MADKTVQEEPSGKTDSAKTELSGAIAFNKNITINMENRISHYDRGPVKAYAAKGRDQAPSNIFAMFCEDHLPPSISKITKYNAVINPSLVRLVESGPIYIPQERRERYVFIFEDTLGKPLMANDLRGGLGMKSDTVLNAVIKPMISMLADLRDRDMVHGNIRPSMMFDGRAKNLERIVLSECLSSPPSYCQPVLYETVERALAAPIGKGLGAPQDDIYAFGVTLAVLLRHHDPMDKYTDDQIIERKYDEGSFVSLLSSERLSASMIELLRGLLHDNKDQRWTISEISNWVDGTHQTSKPSLRRVKSKRPLSFNDGKYMRPEILARDFDKNIMAAQQIIEGGELEQWIMHGLEDKERMERYDSVVKHSEDSARSADYTEKLMCRMSMAMHSEAPIRFKGLSFFPDAIGNVMAEAFSLKKDMQVYTDIVNANFVTQWVDYQAKTGLDSGNTLRKYDTAKSYLRNKAIGYGIERCLYWFNEEVRCLAERFNNFFVESPKDMLSALEEISKKPSRPSMFFDRHCVAFLAVRDKENLKSLIHDLAEVEQHKRVLAEVKTLAAIQKNNSMGALPGIYDWACENMGSLFARYHDRELRIELKKRAEKMKDSGDLSKLLALVDSPTLLQEDQTNFRKAMKIYYDLEKEGREINKNMRAETLYGEDKARMIAVLISCVLSFILICASVVFAINNEGRLF